MRLEAFLLGQAEQHARRPEELGERLQAEHREGDRPDRPERPDHRIPGGFTGNLTALECLPGIFVEPEGDPERARQHQEHEAADIHRRPALRPDIVVDEVDADVAALLHAVRHAAQVAGACEHVADLIGPEGRRVEQVARQHLIDHGQDERRHDPAADHAKGLGEALYSPDEGNHAVSLLIAEANRARSPGRGGRGHRKRNRAGLMARPAGCR